jgi:flagellar biosynthesis/type III secretory pathway M-ring protein FliF/YscJ
LEFIGYVILIFFVAPAVGLLIKEFPWILLLPIVILGFFVHNIPDWLVTTCRIIVYLFIILILIRIIGVKIDEKKKSKERARLEEEGARLRREQDEKRARAERQRAGMERARAKRGGAKRKSTRLEKIERKRAERERAIRERIERDQAEKHARLQREIEIKFREKIGKISALKKELIESGLFYEDDPWDKLPDSDDRDG